VSAQDDLRVAGGLEPTPDLAAQLGVVVDLAVVGDPSPSFVRHRLVAVLEVDNAQSPMAEPDVAAFVYPDSRVVGAAVSDEVAHHP
jgi:hypothetical protein